MRRNFLWQLNATDSLVQESEPMTAIAVVARVSATAETIQKQMTSRSAESNKTQQSFDRRNTRRSSIRPPFPHLTAEREGKKTERNRRQSDSHRCGRFICVITKQIGGDWKGSHKINVSVVLLMKLNVLSLLIIIQPRRYVVIIEIKMGRQADYTTAQGKSV